MSADSLCLPERGGPLTNPTDPLVRPLGTITAVLVALALFQVYARGASSTPLVEHAASIAIGTSMPNVAIAPLSALASSGRPIRTLHDLLGPKCTIVVAFASNCAGTRGAIPYWKGTKAIERHGIVVPVVWLALSSKDSAAEAILSQADLTVPGFGLVSPSDRLALGITAWPSMRLLDANGVLLGSPGIIPEDVQDLPPQCR